MLNSSLAPSDNRRDLGALLSSRLLEILHHEEVFLKAENKKNTLDSTSAIEHDFKYVEKYLREYVENNLENFTKKLKPKGNVLIILSYNEPFVLSLVPILNALVAGNNLVVKPSRRSSVFFNRIWIESGLASQLQLSIRVLNAPGELELETTISVMDAVYFFGSFENAKRVSKICAEAFVEFIPEIETADCKVFKYDAIEGESLRKECHSTLLQSFTHAGQICQRISGVFVSDRIFDQYVEQMINEYDNLLNEGMDVLIPRDFKPNGQYVDLIMSDINKSKPLMIFGSERCFAKIVIRPNASSDFVKNGYFYPTIWLIPFSDDSELISHLNSRKFFLGLNICASDVPWIEKLIQATKFTRYTVNVEHVDIGVDEGWGGRWPSGSGGYKSWIEHFSVPYAVVL